MAFVVLLIAIGIMYFSLPPLPPKEHVGAKGFDTHQGKVYLDIFGMLQLFCKVKPKGYDTK